MVSPSVGTLTSVFYLFVHLASSQAITLNFNSCCADAGEATAFALAYSVPLVSYENFTKPFLATSGANALVPEQQLSTPETVNVVSENDDTLYTFAAIDLSQSDLVFTVPEINDGRYWTFPFYDPYGDLFALVSSVNGNPPGKYLIRRADDAGVPSGLVLLPPQEGYTAQYTGIINYPTTYGFLDARILVLSNTPEDIDTIHGYQNATHITTTPRTTSSPYLPQAPKLTPALLDTSNITDENEKALTLLARLGDHCQPTVTLDRYRVGGIMGLAGIQNGIYRAQSDVNLTEARTAASYSSTGVIIKPGNIVFQKNGWVLQNPIPQGNFMESYGDRYYIAIIGYQEEISSEVLYPTYAASATPLSMEALTDHQAYLFTFYGRPPVDKTKGGFWSLTLYNDNHFFIANQLNRYELGDRNNITYPDGTLVYPHNTGTTENIIDVAVDPEQTFNILMQPQDVAPPSNWTSNWIPTQKGGGGIEFIMRWYAPTEALSNGSYVYPKVEKIDAITA